MFAFNVEASVQIESRRVVDIARVETVRGQRVLVERAGEDTRHLQAEHGHQEDEEQRTENVARSVAVKGFIEPGAFGLHPGRSIFPFRSFPSNINN